MSGYFELILYEFDVLNLNRVLDFSLWEFIFLKSEHFSEICVTCLKKLNAKFSLSYETLKGSLITYFLNTHVFSLSSLLPGLISCPLAYQYHWSNYSQTYVLFRVQNCSLLSKQRCWKADIVCFSHGLRLTVLNSFYWMRR